MPRVADDVALHGENMLDDARHADAACSSALADAHENDVIFCVFALQGGEAPLDASQPLAKDGIVDRVADGDLVLAAMIFWAARPVESPAVQVEAN